MPSLETVVSTVVGLEEISGWLGMFAERLRQARASLGVLSAAGAL